MMSSKDFFVKHFYLVVICVLSIALGFSIAANIYSRHSNVAIAAAPSPLAGDWKTAFEKIAEELAPCVVSITSERTVDVGSIFPDFDDFPFPFKFPGPNDGGKQTQQSTGSGVIVRSDGYILTNDHVVRGADRVTVKLPDGRELKGVVKRDMRTDLALVKVDANNLQAASFADSDKVKVGQWAIAIGNPFGLKNTVTVGVVSAIRREASEENPLSEVAPEVIQTDASINPGNSGGPLVDLDGKIIGINFMIYSRSGGNQGIGFAIPANTAKFVMQQLIEKGRVVRGYLGLVPVDISPVMAEKLGVKKGALVESVEKGAPASEAGIQVKDVIVKIDGKDVENALSLRRIVQAIAPGTTVEIVLVRDKKQIKKTVKLAEAPDIGDQDNESGEVKIGLSVQPLTPEIAAKIGVDKDIKGVVVRKVAPGSPAFRAGVRVNDVITEIDNEPVTSVATYEKAIKKLKSGDTAILVVQRGERSVILEMRID